MGWTETGGIPLLYKPHPWFSFNASRRKKNEGGESNGISEGGGELFPVRKTPSPVAVALAWLQHWTLLPPPPSFGLRSLCQYRIRKCYLSNVLPPRVKIWQVAFSDQQFLFFPPAFLLLPVWQLPYQIICPLTSLFQPSPVYISGATLHTTICQNRGILVPEWVGLLWARFNGPVWKSVIGHL